MSITLDLNSKTITGTMIIDVIITNRTTNTILMHQKNLTISSAQVRYVDQFTDYSNYAYIDADQISNDNTNHILGLKFSKLPDEKPQENGMKLVQLRLRWTAPIGTDDSEGIFISDTIGTNGVNKTFLATNFHPFARSAFPCFDEPQLRANFTLTILTNTAYETVLSNMPVASQKDSKQVRTTVFQTTPAISPSSLAFFVSSSFGSLPGSVDGTRVSLYASSQDRASSSQTTLSKSLSFLNYFVQYFNYPYPITKLDIVALPNFTPYSKIKGVSNLGLIFVDESIITDKYSSTHDMVKSSLLIAKEISEQWLGNLISVKWWNSLWLREGLSSFFKYLCVDNIYPDLVVFDLFLIDTQQDAFTYDALVLDPLDKNEASIVSEEEIMAVVNSPLTDLKGASLAYMLYNRLESIELNLFQSGIQTYLSAFAYDSASSVDFLQVYETATSFLVPSYLGNWVYKNGYPVVTLITGNTSNYVAQQQKYSSFSQQNDFASRWWISLTYQYDNYLAAPIFMRFNQTSLSSPFPAPTASSYFVLNPDRVGFYKVLYSANSLNNILNLLKLSNSSLYFSEEDLSGTLSDLNSMIRSGNRSVIYTIDQVFSFVLQIKEFKSFLIWYNINKIFSSINIMVDHISGIGTLYNNYMKYLISNIYQQVTFSENFSDNDRTKMLRSQVLTLAVSYNSSDSAVNGLTLFRQMRSLNTLSSFNPNLIDAVLLAGAKYGDTSDWEYLKQQYIATQTQPTLSLRLLAAMASTNHSLSLDAAFSFSLNLTEILVGHVVPFMDLLSSRHLQLTWDFFYANWKTYYTILTPNTNKECFRNLFIAVTKRMVLQTQLNSALAFLNNNNIAQDFSLKLNTQIINTNIQSLSVCSAPLTIWLNNWSNNNGLGRTLEINDSLFFN